MGFGAEEAVGARLVRRHSDGVVLHYAPGDEGAPVVAVLASPEDLARLPEGLIYGGESRLERALRDIGVAYENVAAAAALLRIDLRTDIVDGADLGRRGRACGYLDMAGLHLAQNLSREVRDQRKAEGQARGEADRTRKGTTSGMATA